MTIEQFEKAQPLAEKIERLGWAKNRLPEVAEKLMTERFSGMGDESPFKKSDVDKLFLKVKEKIDSIIDATKQELKAL